MFVSASCRASVSNFRPLISDCLGSGEFALAILRKIAAMARNSPRIPRGNLINPTKESEI
jgi:hypothetical protein